MSDYEKTPKDMAALGWQCIECDVCGSSARAFPADSAKRLDDPKLQQLFGDAIEGALAFGFQGNNAPPAGHWLQRFWDIGNAERMKADGTLDALRRAALALAFAAESSPAMQDDYEAVSAAIAKATGVSA